MSALEVFDYEVEVLDLERLRRGFGSEALRGAFEVMDPRANIELSEDRESTLVRIGGHEFPGRVVLAMVGGGASLAVVETWDMPRPDSHRVDPGVFTSPPTLSDQFTGVRAYIAAHVPSGTAINRVVAEIFHQSLESFEHGTPDALPLLLRPEQA
jgi:hypothetical protein